MALRPLSPVELFSSTRHHMGIFRSVTVTCRYSEKLDADALYAALRQVIAAQPMLRVGILNESTNTPRFCHLETIDLRDNVTFKQLPSDDYEIHLMRENEHQLGLLFPSVDTRPPWRIVVLQSQDLLFAFHHSLMDGTSGRRFHEMLLAALNNPVPVREPPLLYFPKAPILPAGQEDAIPFTNSLWFLANSFWGELGPASLQPRRNIPWHGKPTDYRIPNKTHVRALDIPATRLADFLRACRQHGTSLTALFHAVALQSLAKRLRISGPFTSSTPINLRPFMTIPDNGGLRCLITSYTHTHPQTDTDTIWDHAARIKREINAKVSSLPNDDIGGVIGYIRDWFALWARKEGSPRSDSWEVSNIGVLQEDSSGPWHITRILFSNPAMVTGPAIGINVASVQNGPLTATVSWQDGVVDDEIADGLYADLGAFFTSTV